MSEDMDPSTADYFLWNKSSTSSSAPDNRPVIADVPVGVQAGLGILYSLTLLLSVFGNIVVIVVFAFCRRQPRTTLRTFLANLALSDLTTAVFCMPFTFSYTMLNRWAFGPSVCTLVLFMQGFSVVASVGSVTAVAVERFVAVTRPLGSRAANAPRHKWLVVGTVWLVAGLVSAPELKVGRLVAASDGNQRPVPECTEAWPEPKEVWRRTYTFFVLVTTYLLPIGVIAVCYAAVSRHLSRQTIPGHPDEHRDNVRLKSKRRVIKMLIIVTTLFGVCWFPLHLFIVIGDFDHRLRSEGKLVMEDAVSIAYVSVHWLAMSNSFVNPIIYSFLHDGFRSDLKWMLKKICGGNGNEDQSIEPTNIPKQTRKSNTTTVL